MGILIPPSIQPVTARPLSNRQMSRMLPGVLLASSVLWTTSVFAQTEGGAPVAANAGVDEVVVTAQKVGEQRLLDVPISIVALNEQTLQQSGVNGVQDLALLTPGLVFSETIGRQSTQASIRGIAPFGFADPTVVIFTDGFSLGFSRTENNAALFDLERIEVLKGPQATLYGRNALGGVINYITKKPGNEFTGNVQAEYSSYNSYRVSASAGGPLITDRLYGQLAVGQRYNGGFLTNVFDGRTGVNSTRDTDVRAVLRATPSEQLEININLAYSKASDGCGDCAHIPASFGNLNDPNLTSSRAAYLRIGAGLVNFNEAALTVDQDYLGSFSREQHTAVVNVAYRFEGAELTSISGAGESKSHLYTDFNRLPTIDPFSRYQGIAVDNKTLSEELRLASTGKGPLQWLAGLYAYDDKNPSTNTEFGSSYVPPGQTLLLDDSTIESKNRAVFGNMAYTFAGSWTAGAGLRYDSETVNSDSAPSFFGGATSEHSDAHVLLPKLSLSYEPTNDLNLYGTISRGYHAGSPNLKDAPVAMYGPEYVLNYELGVKGEAVGGRVRYEVATYYLKWTQMQIATNFRAISTYTTNAADSRIYGLEASMWASPTDGLTLAGSIALNDARYTSYFDTTGTPAVFGISRDYSGHELVYAPKVSAATSIQYEFPLGTGEWRARLRADAKYTSSRQISPPDVATLDGYTLANVFGGIERKRYEIGVFADNVFDKRYSTGAFTGRVFGFPPLVTLGRPRTVGVRMRINF